ncbi:MAG: AsnC family transcriptional regulator [Dehalococcoidales bacterium]|nr:AsnC family transcriptional regulator [Dehalococcoidales bacterium]
MHLDDIDKKLVNAVQKDFLLIREPFSALGLRLGISCDEVLRRIERLKADGVVGQIGPVFDARRLGYLTTLAAIQVTENQVAQAAKVINQHPGVSHCYQREHHFNLWFTLAVPVSTDMENELHKLGSLVGAEVVLNLPAVRVFKIGAYFDVAGDDDLLPNSSVSHTSLLSENIDLSPTERAVINELQTDLPLVSRPFDLVSARLAMNVEEFLNQCRSLQQRGIMRRFGALIRHSRVGFVANAVVCWVAEPTIVEVAGKKVAEFREISHCYQRRTTHLWPYNLFGVIHSRSREDCKGIVARISQKTSLDKYVVLFSSREFKKARVKYLV